MALDMLEVEELSEPQPKSIRGTVAVDTRNGLQSASIKETLEISSSSCFVEVQLHNSTTWVSAQDTKNDHVCRNRWLRTHVKDSGRLGGPEPTVFHIPPQNMLVGKTFAEWLAHQPLVAVFAHYNTESDSFESTKHDWVRAQPYPVVLVSKSEQTETFQSKNVGSEASAYIEFIAMFWDILPQRAAFLHDHRGSWHQNHSTDKILSNICLSDGYVSLNAHTCYHNFPEFTRLRDLKIYWDNPKNVFMKHGLRSLPTCISHMCCAQFMASRERMQLMEKSFWGDLLIAMFTEFHADSYIKANGGPKTLISGHTSKESVWAWWLEITWHILLGEPHASIIPCLGPLDCNNANSIPECDATPRKPAQCVDYPIQYKLSLNKEKCTNTSGWTSQGKWDMHETSGL